MKPSMIIMFMGWASVFTLTWMLVLKLTPFDNVSISSWIFFFIVALFSSMAQAQKQPESLARREQRLKDEMIDELIEEQKKND